MLPDTEEVDDPMESFSRNDFDVDLENCGRAELRAIAERCGITTATVAALGNATFNRNWAEAIRQHCAWLEHEATRDLQSSSLSMPPHKGRCMWKSLRKIPITAPDNAGTSSSYVGCGKGSRWVSTSSRAHRQIYELIQSARHIFA